MILILIGVLLFVAINMVICICKKNTRNENYLSKDNTSAICGIFMIFIFVSHLTGYMRAGEHILDKLAWDFCHITVGQLMVVPFLFYSGYGVTYQFMHKKDQYLKTYALSRILKIFLLMLILQLIGEFIIWSTSGFTKFNYLALIPFCDEHTWYVSVILVEYVIFFLSVLLFKFVNKKILVVITNVVLTLLLVFTLYQVGLPSYYFDTAIAFPLGVAWALYRDDIDAFLNKGGKRTNAIIVTVISIVLLAGMTTFLRLYDIENVLLYVFVYYIEVILFMVSLLMLTYFFKFNSKPFQILSKYAIYSYLLQIYAFELFTNYTNILSIHRYLYVFCSLLLTVALCFVCEFGFTKCWNLTFGKLINYIKTYKNSCE